MATTKRIRATRRTMAVSLVIAVVVDVDVDVDAVVVVVVVVARSFLLDETTCPLVPFGANDEDSERTIQWLLAIVMAFFVVFGVTA
jgi:hypothetical protein